ncbi:MAG: phenylalanine--tRNA ligase subunit beta [Candidatus Paceibacterota bacterium]
MKFSYTLIKKLAPVVKNKKDLIEKLNEFAFEAVDLGGNSFEVALPANRYSDAASHIGIAREASAIYGKKFDSPVFNLKKSKNGGPTKANFKVSIEDKKLCSRYMGWYFENVKIGSSPKWMKDVLEECGLRPINAVVDIMNYVMLETGQPLHAFDYDKIAQSQIIVRKAKKGEKIVSLDDKKYDLNENILVIADAKNPLAIAGIKGGKFAEVVPSTKRIVVEAANFAGANIYRASKSLKLTTDASVIFSHNISPVLAEIGLNRAGQLLEEITGAKAGKIVDVNYAKPGKKIIKFDTEKFKKLIGVDLNVKICGDYLRNLSFGIKAGNKQTFLVEVPAWRSDVSIFEDLAEEITRLYGLNKLKPQPPKIYIHPSGFEDQIVLKDKIRKILTGFGFDEVLNYSFVGDGDLDKNPVWKNKLLELENPISGQAKYMRPSLTPNLIKNIESNFRFFDDIKIFEIGKVFYGNTPEKLNLGILIASKKDKQVFFELKGAIEKMFKNIGLVDYMMPEPEKGEWVNDFTGNLISSEILEIESEDKVIGYLGRVDYSGAEAVLAEINLDLLLELVEEEHEYRPLSKYPSIMRDVSVLVSPAVKVGEIMRLIQESDFKNIEDVDMIDEYEMKDKRSLTFRIIFHSEERTLKEEEASGEMEKIKKLLKSKFGAEIR